MVDHHPDVTKYAKEALDLKAELKRVKGDSSGGKDFTKELAKTHKYTLQLERQLRHFLVKGIKMYNGGQRFGNTTFLLV